MGATSAPGNQTIRDQTLTLTSGSSLIRARLLNMPPPRREPAIRPTSKPIKNTLAPKDVLQAIEEDDGKENSEDIATTVIEAMSC